MMITQNELLSYLTRDTLFVIQYCINANPGEKIY